MIGRRARGRSPDRDGPAASRAARRPRARRRFTTTVCLGRITADQQTEDGRYYLVLQGLSRARIVREEDADQPYRVAQLDLLPDPEHPFSPHGGRRATTALAVGVPQVCFRNTISTTCLRRALKEAVPLGILCDVLADAMSLESQVAYRVFAQTDVKERCRLVLRLIEERLGGGPCSGGAALKSGNALKSSDKEVPVADAGWPPEFSLN